MFTEGAVSSLCDSPGVIKELYPELYSQMVEKLDTVLKSSEIVQLNESKGGTFNATSRAEAKKVSGLCEKTHITVAGMIKEGERSQRLTHTKEEMTTLVEDLDSATESLSVINEQLV